MSAQSKPKAVLIADVHYNVHTLPLADASVRAAIREAESLNVPLVVAGDLHDTKALMRGECVKAMIDTFSSAKCRIIIIPGNHCMLNEKGTEHSLEFLRPYVDIMDHIEYDEQLGAWLVPYQSDAANLIAFLSHRDTQGGLVIAHQGVQSADMGHYQIDRTSLPKEAFANHRVISGHYHRAQDIKCGRPRKGAVGLFSYIGNPYTLSFGEADHPAKGYQILGEDGLLTPVPLNLRKHVILDVNINDEWRPDNTTIKPEDLLWLKVRGSYLELENLDKKALGVEYIGHSNFKLDKIPTDALRLEVKTEKLTGEQILDNLIDNTGEKADEKKAMKSLWREVLE